MFSIVINFCEINILSTKCIKLCSAVSNCWKIHIFLSTYLQFYLQFYQLIYIETYQKYPFTTSYKNLVTHWIPKLASKIIIISKIHTIFDYSNLIESVNNVRRQLYFSTMLIHNAIDIFDLIRYSSRYSFATLSILLNTMRLNLLKT